jgi:hypothetical protein
MSGGVDCELQTERRISRSSTSVFAEEQRVAAANRTEEERQAALLKRQRLQEIMVEEEEDNEANKDKTPIRKKIKNLSSPASHKANTPQSSSSSPVTSDTARKSSSKPKVFVRGLQVDFKGNLKKQLVKRPE